MFLFKNIRRSWLPPTGRMHACIVFRGLRPVLNLSSMRDSGEASRTLAGQSRADIFLHAAWSDNSSRLRNSGANWRFAPGRRSARACLFNPKTAKAGVFKKILLSSICSYLSVTGEAGFRRRAASIVFRGLRPVLNLSSMRDSGEAPRTLAGQSRASGTAFPHARSPTIHLAFALPVPAGALRRVPGRASLLHGQAVARQRRQTVVPKLVVAVEVLATQREAEQPLGDQPFCSTRPWLL